MRKSRCVLRHFCNDNFMCRADFHNEFMTRTRFEPGKRVEEKRIHGGERDVKNKARDVK